MPKKNYSQSDFDKELKQLESLMKNNHNEDDDDDYNSNDDRDMFGGKEEDKRHFKIVMLDGKEVARGSEIGDARANITMKANPLDAAKKLFRSVCKHRKLSGMNKLKCHAEFYIKETTNDSHKKIYGPYSGKYVKMAPKTIDLGGKKVTYHMKPVVKKVSGSSHMKHSKKSMMKGGRSSM